MLFVVSKDKFMCYIIAFSTVIILIGMAMLKKPSEETLQIMAEVKEVNMVNDMKNME